MHPLPSLGKANAAILHHALELSIKVGNQLKLSYEIEPLFDILREETELTSRAPQPYSATNYDFVSLIIPDGRINFANLTIEPQANFPHGS